MILELIKELWIYMKSRKKFWLAPIFLILIIFGSLIILTQGSLVAPFIYTIF